MNKDLVYTTSLIYFAGILLKLDDPSSIPTALFFVPIAGVVFYYVSTISAFLFELGCKILGALMEMFPYFSLVSFLACVIWIITLL